MSEFDSSVMVALLPTTTYWCHQELPHVTLIYAGQIPDLKPTVCETNWRSRPSPSRKSSARSRST
jgi:hypothetical protein